LNSEKPLEPQDSQSHFSASESLENQGHQEPEIEIGDKCPSLAFEQINEVTWKLTDARGTNAWDGYRGGYRTTRAVAWLMGIGGGRWVVRYRGKASRPMRLAKAKAYAIEMVKRIRPGKVITDPIRNLHRLHLKFAEPMLSIAEIWSIETANYPPLTMPPISAPDNKFQGDPLEYYEDGFPKLTDGLRRMVPHMTNSIELRDGQPDGIGNKSNLNDWADYAKRNSYHADKSQLRHDIGTERANADYAANDVEDWRQPQRKSEGRGWAEPVNPAAKVYGGKGGSKRD
jgi:hypothetical protein